LNNTLTDGYLRMTLDDVLALRFTHLISGLDQHVDLPDQFCGTSTTISGYTEWVASNDRTVTVGWDWILETAETGIRCLRVGQPRSNVLIGDLERRPFDWRTSEAVIGSVVDSIPWQESARSALAERYA